MPARRLVLVPLLAVLAAAPASAATVEVGATSRALAISAQVDGVPTPTVNRFNGARAFGLARLQVRFGPRPAGSPALRRLAARLRPLLPGGRLEAAPGRLQNVVGRLPGTLPAIVVAAHYDTKDGIEGFVGANDGAGGTAVVLELARALRTGRTEGAPAIDLVLFDGEENPNEDLPFLTGGVRGSRAYLRAHRSDIGAVIVVDFVGQRRLRLPREEGSHPALWARLREAGARVGVGAIFPDRTVAEILDDHTPFMDAGIPAIDLIDFSYRHWHLPSDTLDKLSPRSLDATGEALVELLRGLTAADLVALTAPPEG